MKQFLFDKDIFLKTDYSIALDSPDHINPHGGTRSDFTDGTDFAEYLLDLYPKKKTLIDLGTATGKVPLTMRETGMLSVGLEGSDTSQKKQLSAWREMPDIVRTCDISRPFQIIDENNNPVKFDFVTSWGVFEHIHSDRLGILWNNIVNLMHKKSIGIFNIDLGCNEFHQSGGVPQEEWRNKLEEHFKIIEDILLNQNNINSLKDLRKLENEKLNNFLGKMERNSKKYMPQEKKQIYNRTDS